jgi:hypothetical protein
MIAGSCYYADSWIFARSDLEATIVRDGNATAVALYYLVPRPLGSPRFRSYAPNAFCRLILLVEKISPTSLIPTAASFGKSLLLWQNCTCGPRRHDAIHACIRNQLPQVLVIVTNNSQIHPIYVGGFANYLYLSM